MALAKEEMYAKGNSEGKQRCARHGQERQMKGREKEGAWWAWVMEATRRVRQAIQHEGRRQAPPRPPRTTRWRVHSSAVKSNLTPDPAITLC